MKKIFVYIILAVLLLCTSVPAYAEQFSVRNGITFGMTVNEVKKAEGNQHLLISDWKKEKYKNYLLYRYLPIAGVPNSSLEYTFDLQDDLLYEIVYSFEEDKTNLTMQYVLDKLRELFADLSAKYGDPIHDSDGAFFPACSDEFLAKIEISQVSSSYELLAYAEWLVPYDEYWVVIDLVGYGTGYPKIDSYSYFLAYKMVSNETVIEYLMESLTEESDRQTQKNNDL